MAFENLTEREKVVLFNLISYYINSADPVGSRVIANRFKMGVSSATIRNTLQDLEELGLVQQPHTSAGRIPTDVGYRVYVDYLLKREELTEQEKERIKQGLLREGRGINEILGQTTRVLSEITSQLGVAIAPRFEAGVLKRVELIPVSSGRLMVVVIVESGLARSVVLEVESNITDARILEVEQILNERLGGLSLGEIRRTISDRMADVRGTGRLLNLIVDSEQRIWYDDQSGGIKLAGMDNLMRQPEFSNLERLSRLMKVLDDNSVLSGFFNEATDEGMFITIGTENKYNEIIDCSLVTSSYRVGNISGKVSVIGPTRMPYSKLLSVVEYTARTITDVLSGAEERSD